MRRQPRPPSGGSHLLGVYASLPALARPESQVIGKASRAFWHAAVGLELSSNPEIPAVSKRSDYTFEPFAVRRAIARSSFYDRHTDFQSGRLVAKLCRVGAFQTVESFEVVVSDNASDDATPEVLGEFDDERLSVVRQPRNIGPIGNWNACLSAANRTYVTMLSDDDSVAPFFLARCNSLITDDRDLSLVVTLGDVFDGPTGLTRPATRSRVLRSGIYQGTEILKEFLRGNISPQMCTLAIKTEALRARGGFPAGWPHTGDLASWVPLLLQGKAGLHQRIVRRLPESFGDSNRPLCARNAT